MTYAFSPTPTYPFHEAPRFCKSHLRYTVYTLNCTDLNNTSTWYHMRQTHHPFRIHFPTLYLQVFPFHPVEYGSSHGILFPSRSTFLCRNEMLWWTVLSRMKYDSHREPFWGGGLGKHFFWMPHMQHKSDLYPMVHTGMVTFTARQVFSYLGISLCYGLSVHMFIWSAAVWGRPIGLWWEKTIY